MRLLEIGLAAVVASAAVAQDAQERWQRLSHESKTASVAAGDKALLKACAPEIAAMVADARQKGATITDAEVPAAISEMITNWWWAEGATGGIRAEYQNTDRRKREGEIGYAFGQCAIATIDAWKEGVRDPAQLRAKWRPFPAGYRSGAAPAVSTPIAKNPPAEDPAESMPVDCVRLNDTPGSFKNICDFPVYYTYCGINPKPGSWTGACDDPNNKLGLDGIAAHAVQGAFTSAERMYWFACKKPKTPKDVKFIAGKGLYGTCK
jgi:hypothetical protein